MGCFPLPGLTDHVANGARARDHIRKSKCRQRHGPSRGALVGVLVASRRLCQDTGVDWALRCDELRLRTTDVAARGWATWLLAAQARASSLARYLRTAPCDARCWYLARQRKTTPLPSYCSARRVLPVACEPRGAACACFPYRAFCPAASATAHRTPPLPPFLLVTS